MAETQAKIINRFGYRCAPDGHTVKAFKLGDIVEGQIAIWAVDEKSAIWIKPKDKPIETASPPALEAKIETATETKPRRARGRPRKADK